MPPIIKLIVIWLLCGLMARWISLNTPKIPGEDAIPIGRCLLYGPIMLLITLFELPWGNDED